MIKNLAVLAIVSTSANASLLRQSPIDSLYIGGIDKDDLMQNQKPHWQKQWPEGDTDNGENDECILDIKACLGDGKKKKKDGPLRYPWTLDSDIVDSQKHLGDVEAKQGAFSVEGYQDRGLKILNSGNKDIKNWYL